MKTAEKIYKKYRAKWVKDVFVSNPAIPENLPIEDKYIYEAMNEFAKQQAIAFHDWNNIPVGSYDTTDELYELFKTKQP